MAGFTRELGIDLGTNNTVIAEGNQVLWQQPTVVAIFEDEQKMVEWGQSAKDMTGRVPENIKIISPLVHGVIAEYDITETMLHYLVRDICGRMFIFRPQLMLTIPYGATSVESRAVHEAGLSSSRDVYLVQQPLAAALGVDLPISTPSGNMVICLGGGTNQSAVLAMNSIITAESDRNGGLRMDEAIIGYVRKKFGVIIGQPTAEMVKIPIGAAVPQDDPQSIEIQGQDQVSGLPKSVVLTTEDVVEALQEPLQDVVGLVKRVLEQTQPEMMSDIIDRGAALCGGGALLRGIDRYLTKNLGIPAYLVDNPLTWTALGASRALALRESLRRSLPVVH
jgi:rod shape-determining protein MreB